jgi:hypothetical protein
MEQLAPVIGQYSMSVILPQMVCCAAIWFMEQIKTTNKIIFFMSLGTNEK